VQEALSRSRRDAASLEEDKATLRQRLKAVAVEASKGREQEEELSSEVEAARRRLASEEEQLQDQQARCSLQGQESHELLSAEASLEACLEQECNAFSEFRESLQARSCASGPGRRDLQALREELVAESERLADSSERIAELEGVCKAAGAEVAAQAQSMRMDDMVRRHLKAETKSVFRQAEELKVAMEARAAAQTKELKKAEVRREQLEAETSLMAMEVATLSRDLGGRLLGDNSSPTFSRRSVSVHDILREAWRSSPATSSSSKAVPGSIKSILSTDEQRHQRKAIQDAHLVNLYLRWLRRGPCRRMDRVLSMAPCSLPRG